MITVGGSSGIILNFFCLFSRWFFTVSIVNHPEQLPFPGDSIRDQTWSPIIGGHQQPLSSGHVNSPSQKGHVCRIARLGKMFQFFPSTKDQLMVTYWFGARCFGFRKDPPMKGIGILKLRAPEIHPKPPGPKPTGPKTMNAEKSRDHPQDFQTTHRKMKNLGTFSLWTDKHNPMGWIFPSWKHHRFETHSVEPMECAPFSSKWGEITLIFGRK